MPSSTLGRRGLSSLRACDSSSTSLDFVPKRGPSFLALRYFFSFPSDDDDDDDVDVDEDDDVDLFFMHFFFSVSE